VAQVACYALVIGLAGLIFFYIGVSMGWLYVRDSFARVVSGHPTVTDASPNRPSWA
jgi:hypothetical protein